MTLAAVVVMMTMTAGADSIERTSDSMETGRFRAAVVSDGTHVFSIGGATSSSHTADIVKYNPATRSMSVVASLPSGRAGASAVWTGSIIYVFGGYNSTGYVDEVVKFDPATNKVTTLSPKLPSPRAFSSAVWDGRSTLLCPQGCAYVLGGSNNTHTYADILVLNPALPALTTHTTKLPKASAHTAAAWNGTHAFLFGGWLTENQVIRFDPALGQVKQLGGMPSDKHGHAAVWDGQRYVYLLGGDDLSFIFTFFSYDIVRYEPATGTFLILNATMGRVGVGAAWAGGKGYTMGGHGGLFVGLTGYAHRFDPISHLVAPYFWYDPAFPREGQKVQFSCSTTCIHGNLTWNWEFGDGATNATARNPTHTYSRDGRFTIRLTAKDYTGATRTITQGIWVDRLDPPTADFEVSPRTPGPRVNVTITDRSSEGEGGPIVSRVWSVDWTEMAHNQTTFTIAAPERGHFSVALKVTDQRGKTSTATKTIRVQPVETARPPDPSSAQPTQAPSESPPEAAPPKRAPLAEISYSPSAPYRGEPVRFQAKAYDPDGLVAAVEWDFGDNATAEVWEPVHAFEAAGTYVVRLTVEDDEGFRAEVNRRIQVAGPGANFQYTPSLPRVGQRVYFVDRSDEPSSIRAWRWDFGDGSVGTGGQVEHAFSSPGRFPVTLAIDDGTPAGQSVTLVVEVLPQGAQIQLSAWPEKAVARRPVAFTATLATSQPVESWFWLFGDDQQGHGASPQHEYDRAGTYEVTVRATMADGSTQEARLVMIVEAHTPGGLVAAFEVEGTSQAARVRLIDRSNGTADHRVLDWRWELGDGTRVEGKPVVEHVYRAPGPYLVTLRATDGAGRQAVHSSTIQIPGEAPRATFTVNPKSPAAGEAITFRDSSVDGDGKIVAWAWESSEGQRWYGPSVATAWEQGQHWIRLTVTDDDGFERDTRMTIIVVPQEYGLPVTGEDRSGTPGLGLWVILGAFVLSALARRLRN